jgi:nickel-dependent lactate racemase
MSAIDVAVGASRWTLEAPEGCLVNLESRLLPGEPVADPRAAVREALEHPLRFGHPLRKAVTPDDRIALVIDDRLPKLGEMVAGTLEYLVVAGIGPEQVTIIIPPGSDSTEWIDELPDEFADVHTETHQPGDRKHLSYLATTKKGRRIYLNRTLVDADQIVSISGRRYDPLFGYAGCEGILYPALGDNEARQALCGRLTMDVPAPAAHGIRAEAAEVATLLGPAIYLQVIEAGGDAIARICAGLIDTSADGMRLLDERWRFSIAEPVDVVVAGLSGTRSRHDFAVLARAAAAASRAVKPGGAVVLLSEAAPTLGQGMELLRQSENSGDALQLLLKQKPPDLTEAFQWASAAASAHIFLASELNPELVEEIFATPILSPVEAQRLVANVGKCLFLPDADKTLVLVGQSAK